MTRSLTPQDCVSEFIKRLTALDPEKSAYDKFRDFCEMAYLRLRQTHGPLPRARG
jgi:hypothetical protein